MSSSSCVEKSAQRLCLSDWDGTIRKGYTVIDFTGFLVANNAATEADFEELLDCFKRHKEGRIDYEELVFEAGKTYLQIVQGIDRDQLNNLVNLFVLSDNKLGKLALTLLPSLKEKNFHIVVISGAPKNLLEAFIRLQDLPIDEVYGLEAKGDDCSKPRNIINHGGHERKLHVAQKFQNPNQPKAFLALGDSISDAPLLEASEYGVVVEENGSNNFNKISSIVQRKGTELLSFDIDDDGKYLLQEIDLITAKKDSVSASKFATG